MLLGSLGPAVFTMSYWNRLWEKGPFTCFHTCWMSQKFMEPLCAVCPTLLSIVCGQVRPVLGKLISSLTPFQCLMQVDWVYFHTGASEPCLMQCKHALGVVSNGFSLLQYTELLCDRFPVTCGRTFCCSRHLGKLQKGIAGLSVLKWFSWSLQYKVDGLSAWVKVTPRL